MSQFPKKKSQMTSLSCQLKHTALQRKDCWMHVSEEAQEPTTARDYREYLGTEVAARFLGSTGLRSVRGAATAGWLEFPVSRMAPGRQRWRGWGLFTRTPGTPQQNPVPPVFVTKWYQKTCMFQLHLTQQMLGKGKLEKNLMFSTLVRQVL